MGKTFSPDINGFTVSAVKTMLGTEGRITRCNLLFNGKKTGEYFDPADGCPYDFHEASGFSSDAIEDAVASFPPFKRDFGIGGEFCMVRWNIGILVEEVIRLKSLSKSLADAMAKDMDMGEIECWKRNIGWTVLIPRTMQDAEAEAQIARLMKQKKLPEYEYRRISKPEELCIRNAHVTLDMLR